MLPKAIEYNKASNLQDAISALKEKNTWIHAGGTDLLCCLRDNVFEADRVVSLSNLKDLKKIQTLSNGGLRIGPLVTITEIEEHPGIAQNYTALHQGAFEVASPQIRNQGTLGGNLCQKPRCWYYRGEFHCIRKGGEECFAVEGENQFHCILGGNQCYIVHPSDTAPTLIALEAAIEISGPKGKRKIPLEKFYVLPEDDPQRETYLDRGEIVTAIILPPPLKDLKSSYRKVRTRRAWDFSLAGLALAIRFDGEKVVQCRAVLSGAAPVPWRAKELEKAISGQTIDEKSAMEAAEAAMKDCTPMSKNAYKIDLFKRMITEELLRYTVE